MKSGYAYDGPRRVDQYGIPELAYINNREWAIQLQRAARKQQSRKFFNARSTPNSR